MNGSATSTSDLARLAEAFAILPDGVVAVDGEGRIAYANPAAEALFGYGPGALTGRPLDVLLPERFRARHATHLARARASRATRLMGERPLLCGLTRHGTEIPVSIAVGGVEADGRRLQIAVVRDQRALATTLGQVAAAAETDPLTRLGNRRHISLALARLAADGHPYSLLYLDLDGFKPINDRHGHAFGDAVLGVFARRLRGGLRRDDACARVGGDEFAVVLARITEPAPLEALARKLHRHLCAPMHVEGRMIRVGVSIGGAVARPGEPEVALMARADAAMYRAKREAAGAHVHVDPAPG